MYYYFEHNKTLKHTTRGCVAGAAWIARDGARVGAGVNVITWL